MNLHHIDIRKHKALARKRKPKKPYQKKRVHGQDTASQYTIPISVLSTNLSPLEATVKYLREEYNLNYRIIGKLLNRNERTIWYTYFKSKDKYKGRFEILEHEISIPLSLFQDRSASILQHTVHHLKHEHGHHLYKISKILNKNRNSVWSAYNRAVVKKNENK
jgi:hypothetical protein